MEKDSVKKLNLFFKTEIKLTLRKSIELKTRQRQGDSISAYIFILVLEIVLPVTKSSKKINGLKIFKYEFIYTAYANDSMFSLKNQKSVIEVLKVFDRFSKVSVLNPNASKCEWQELKVWKGEVLNSLKILEIHFSYNKKLVKIK